MKRFRLLLVPALALAASAQALPAQNVGDRVRVRTEVRLLIGQVVAVRGDRIDLALDGWELAELEGPVYSVTRAGIRLMETSRGMALPWKWSAAASVGGAFLTAAITNMFEDSLFDHSDTGSNALLGAAAGGGLALAVGALLSEDERWQPVSLEGEHAAFRPSIEFGSVHGFTGAVLGARLRF